MFIRNKKEAYALLHKGFFGNKLRMWDRYEDLLASTYSGTVSMRYKLDGGGFYAYELPIHCVPDMIDNWKQRGADERLITYNESAPDHKLLIQGELLNTEKGLYFFYSTKKEKMRIVLSECEHAFGLQVREMLKYYMTSASYEDLVELLDIFPHSVIEFSVYSINLGDKRGRNAVIWEIRNY